MRASLFLAAGIGLFAATIGASPQADDREGLIAGYRSWTKATKAPQDMSPALAMSCIGPMKWNRSDNPHVKKVFVVYVNKIGAKAMFKRGTTVFPNGTVIVKEKYDRTDLAVQTKPQSMTYDRKLKPTAKPLLLTVMVKIRGNWEYFSAGGDGKVQKGSSVPCRNCHEFSKSNDFVFRPYVQGAAQAPNPWR